MQHIVGLDIETSGSTFESSVTLQIGIYDRQTGFSYARDMGDYYPPLRWPGDDYARWHNLKHPVVEPEALKVNGWTKERYEASEPHAEVDIALADRLKDRYKPKSLVAVGWNVAGFDIPFVRRDLPRTFKFLHYRTVDLNACVFMLAGNDYDFYHKFKDDLKVEAASRLAAAGYPHQPHDAGWDAREATEVFYILRSRYGLIIPRKSS